MGCCKLHEQGIADGVTAYRNNGIRFQSNYVELRNQRYYTGMQYQCVEYARRYLLLTKGVLFQEIGRAFEIFPLKSVRDINTGKDREFASFPQDGNEPPKVGDLIIYQKSRHQWVGHVAVVSIVENNLVGLAEQNFSDEWEGPNYSRKLILQQNGDKYHLSNIRPNGQQANWEINEVILGWKRVI